MDLERQLCQVLSSREEDGRDILGKLLQTSRQMAGMSENMHAGCYECLGQGKFPVRRIQDEEGNKWYKHETRLYHINHRVHGAHASIYFQCEDCWTINLEGRLPAEGLDDAYIMLIR